MINFADVENSVRTLKAQFQAGQMDEETFEGRLLELIEVADDGYYWMFGHESEQWYRYETDHWVAASPDDIPPASPSAPAHPPTSPPTDWNTLNVGWFMASLVFIGAIGVVVYSTTF